MNLKEKEIMRYIRIAKDNHGFYKSMFYSNKIVREFDPKLFFELSPHLGQCENDFSIKIEDENYIHLLLKQEDSWI